MERNQIMDRLEDVADKVVRHGKHILPHVARICLFSTFLEDGLRMWFQWSEQASYIASAWDCGIWVGHLFVIVNFLGQLVPCAMILLRKFVPIACCVLFAIIFIQTVGYSILWNPQFLLRNFALAGGLILLWAESQAEGRSLLAGLPQLESRTPKMYMVLSGRILVALMFLTLLHMSLHPFLILQDVIGSGLLILVSIGYKTKLSALVLVVYLMLCNVTYNAFWMYPSSRAMHDFLKYDFFQTMSVIGGLLLIVQLGPGGIGVDDYKKRW